MKGILDRFPAIRDTFFGIPRKFSRIFGRFWWLFCLVLGSRKSLEY